MNTKQKQNGAQLTLSILEQHGVTDIFGYPGGAIMPIYDAIYDSPIKHYLCRHEQGAAFAALGYSRASGKVGVCMATSGPGATNLLTGIADAMADSIPMIAITGQVSAKAMGSDAFQEIDVLGLSLACTKHSFQVKNLEQLSEYLNQAFEIALSGRPGPVLIDIPKDIQIAQLEVAENQLGQIEKNLKIVPAPHSDDRDFCLFEQAATLIKNSKQPILYVGGGVGMADAVEELKDFIALADFPSVITLKALGAVDPENEFYLGMLGMHGTKPANLCVQGADCLVVLGARFDDRVTGKLSEFAPNAKIVHLDIDPAEVNKRRMADVAIIGNLKQGLPLLTKILKECSEAKDLLNNIEPWKEQCRDLIKENQLDFTQDAATPEGGRIFAPELLNILSNKLNKKAIVTTDVGQHQMWAAQTMEFEHPTQFLSSGALGTMGFGIPAAIGAQVSLPDTTVVSVSGDGSVMMNIQELATINRYKLPVKILLIDNSRLGMVRQWQELFFEERYSETVLDDNPDFAALAEAFNIKAKTISLNNEVEDSLDEMLNYPGAFLLHVVINALENVWPLVPPDTSNEKMIDKSVYAASTTSNTTSNTTSSAKNSKTSSTTSSINKTRKATGASQ
jgi:acetolactate synthase I/II/III large subunit